MAVREMLRPVEANEYGKKDGPTRKKYLLYVRNLRINVSDEGPTETTRKVKTYCPQYGAKISHSYYPVNSRHGFLNDVVFQVNNLTEQDLITLKSTYVGKSRHGRHEKSHNTSK